MSRPKQLRRLSWAPRARLFRPSTVGTGAVRTQTIILSLDECESLRLADLECRTQKDAARQMGISRATFGRIVESGRSKVARALVEGCRLEISGGSFFFGEGGKLRCPRCRRRQAGLRAGNDYVECRRCCQPLLSNEHPKKHYNG